MVALQADLGRAVRPDKSDGSGCVRFKIESTSKPEFGARADKNKQQHVVIEMLRKVAHYVEGAAARAKPSGSYRPQSRACLYVKGTF